MSAKTTQPKSKKAAKPETKKPDAKQAPATKAAKPAKEKRASAIDAAIRVLSESKEPMNAREMIEAMAAKGYWSSPNGQTPHATLYSAILREIATKGNQARFKKTDRGRFTVA
ncbi:MAG: winged helix-turn-helix domain-containing protein [Pirellulales bacterium]|nr:winged helix-turn-helix domain-containing protein [Pirellulales bacterium]